MTTQGPKILIVDDEKTVRRSLNKCLTLKGFSCTEAGNAAHALASARTSPGRTLPSVSSGRPASSPSARRAAARSGAGRGSASFLRFPTTSVRSGRAPSASQRRASSALWHNTAAIPPTSSRNSAPRRCRRITVAIRAGTGTESEKSVIR